MTEPPQPKTARLQTRILTVFMLVALGTCVSVLSSIDTSSLLSIDRPQMFLFGVLSQLAVTAVYVLAWQVNLRCCGIRDLTYQDSLVHSGIAFLGKYIPGKVGGLIMRGVTVHKHTPSSAIIIKATTIEQATMVHAGLIVCCILWSLDASPGVSISILLAALASLILVFFPGRIIALTRKLTERFSRITSALDVLEEGFQKTYFTIMLFMWLIWLLSALSVFFVLQSFSVDIAFDKILLITTLSFLTGFFAVILPAGIGA